MFQCNHYQLTFLNAYSRAWRKLSWLSPQFKETAEGVASGFVVETEAYLGPEDRAAHHYGNRSTERTEYNVGKASFHLRLYDAHPYTCECHKWST